MKDFDGCVFFGEYSACFKTKKDWYLYYKMVDSMGDTIKGKTALDWCDALSPYVSTEGGIPDPMDTVDMFISQDFESHYALIDWDRFDPNVDCSVRDFEEK